MSRVQAACSTWLLDRRLKRERRAEAQALVSAGGELCAAEEPPQGLHTELIAPWGRARALELRRIGLDARLAESLERDRRDWREASALGRWLVVARGLIDRLRLREAVWGERGRRDAALAALARGALAHAESQALLPARERGDIERIRGEIEALERRRAELQAPHGGDALPPWLRRLVREAGQMTAAVREQLERKFLLRLPALAAAVAAWWLARSYTTSDSIEAIVHDAFGTGRPGLASSTLGFLQFWLPILVAALTAYLMSRLARWAQRRYGGEGA